MSNYGERRLGSKNSYPRHQNHNWKIRSRKQRTCDDKYFFVNWNIKSWKQLPVILLASFPCKLNTFRKTVKNAVRSKGIQVGIEWT